MSSTLSLTQSEFSAGRLPILLADLKDDPVLSKQPSLGRRGARALARFLITFCIGVVGALAWQSYSDAARQMIASSSSQLGWLVPQAAPIAQTAPDVIAPAAPSPDQPQLKAMSLDLAAVRQSVDQVTASQEQITRTVDQLAAAQEQMTRDITRLQATERYILYKMSEPLRRPEPAPARKPVPRLAPPMTGASPNAHHAATSSISIGPSSPLPVLLTRLATGHM